VTASAVPAQAPGAGPARAAAPGDAVIATLDRGTATLAAALIGRVEGRWRLLVSAAVAAGADADELIDVLGVRLRANDPALADLLDLPAEDAPRSFATSVRRVEVVGSPAPLAAVLAATEESRRRLEADVSAAGWRTVAASAQVDDPLAATRLATRPDVSALVVGTGDPVTPDERDLVGELVALAGGVAERRPEVSVVLVGAAAARSADLPPATDVASVAQLHGDAPDDLRSILAARRADHGGARRADRRDARQALVAATATLAEVLDLRVELIDIGISGALRARAEPAAEHGSPARIAALEVPSAVLGLAEDEATLDRIEAWTTLGIDRARLRDRLAELRISPWVDLGGDGALLRAAALRAALERLAAATDAELGGPAPDLVVLAGGAWSAVPAPAALLVLADGLRRPGVVQVALDQARLLAPLGTLEDAGERRRIVRDLVADALVPLGTLAIARGIRGGRGAGHLRLAAGGVPVEMELAAGRLALVDLPPGGTGEATLSFRSSVDLGVRGRRFAVAVTGGLAGFVIDLRDIPLRLPVRADARRDVLARWESALWPERDR
jgi:hypothetical protein